jgi:membrane protease YdiL (CAAX protease family)
MGVLFTAAALSLACLLLCLPALRKTSSRRYVGFSVLFVMALTTSTDLRRVFHRIPRIPGQYNWTGKVLELIVCTVAMALLLSLDNWKREELGLTLRFNKGTGRDVLLFLVPVLIVESVALWFLVPGQIPTFEDHLFQLTAPGITEELAFRGVLLALIDRASLGRRRILGADLGWSAVVTSIIFGLWHGLDVSSHLKVSLDIAPMVIPMLGGFVLAWCRARSGTLILPILAHAGMNEFANLIALVKAPKLQP